MERTEQNGNRTGDSLMSKKTNKEASRGTGKEVGKGAGKGINCITGKGAGKEVNRKTGKGAKVQHKEPLIRHEVFALFISPTHNTEKAVRALASGIAKEVSSKDYFAIDLTSFDSRDTDFDFEEGDIVILASPTYAGRVPNKLMPYFKESVFGNGALGISLVTYGNRAYDDSLKELSYIMSENEFEVTAAVAVPSEHAFVPQLAQGRPNEADLKELFELGTKIGREILNHKTTKVDLKSIPGNSPDAMVYYVPKKEDGTPASFLKAMPITDSLKCSGCGECKAVCPMNCFANSVLEPEGICIKCQGCIKACPESAKHFENEDFESHREYLKNNYSEIVREIEVIR